MTRLITKQMRDSFQCKRVEMTMLSFYQGGEPCFEEKAKKQRITILRRTVK